MQLEPPGGFFDETVIRNLFPNSSEGARKLLVHRAVTNDDVVRIKPGIYLLPSKYRKSELHPYAVAALLHWPSHISLESALAHHGLIPEAVQQISSVTTSRSRSFSTPLGLFSFQRVPARYPLAGIELIKLGNHSWAFVSSPLRALADMIYLNRAVSWDKDGAGYALESLRIEEEDLRAIPTGALDEICDSLSNKRVVTYLQNLAKEVTHAS